MTIIPRLFKRTEPITPEEDYFALEDVARRLVDSYSNAVADGCTRWGLARTISGLAGCLLAQYCTGSMAWPRVDDSEIWSVEDDNKLSGLLLLAVASCADDGPCYRSSGLVSELQNLAPELAAVAAAYSGQDSTLIGQRLHELGCAIGRTTGSAAGEALMPLAHAHGFTGGDES